MESYIHLEDTGPNPDVLSLETRAAKEGFIRNRVNYLQTQGRLLRLIEEKDQFEIAQSKSHSHTKVIGIPSRQSDHRDALMSHMVQVRNAMLNEAKLKPGICRRVARMVQVYWERIEGKDERVRLEEERERKRKTKEMIKGLRRRWGLAVKVVRAKLLAAQKLEQDRLGKEHLQNMLQRSTGLLEAQRDDLLGEGGGEDDSEGTDDVSESEEDSEASDGAEDEAKPVDQDEDGDNGAEIEDSEAEEDFAMDISTSDPLSGKMNDNDEPAASDGSDGLAIARQESQEMEEVEDQEGVDEDVEEDEDSTGLQALLSEDVEMMDNSRPPSPLVISTTADGTLPIAARPSDVIFNGHGSLVTRSPLISIQVPPENLDVSGLSTGNDGLLSVSVSVDLSQSHSSPEVSVAASTLPIPPSTLGLPMTPDPTSSSAPSSPGLPHRRARKSASAVSLIQTEDPDVNDIEFEATSDVDERDQEVDMDSEDDGSSEDDGLLADADLPIEELLKRYGYPTPVEAEKNPEVETDKSLLDESFPVPETIVEGKRQRRVRAVWTPEDNPPPPPKRPKIEEVEVELESTPELSEDEEGEDDEEDDEEEEVKSLRDEEGNLRVRPPFLLRGTLRPYQQAGLEWLASLYANKMNGILADEMGLGKTIQTIALLGHLACDKGVWGHHLIIVPTSVILNWEMEFKKFLPGMKVLTYYGNQKERKEKRIGWHTENAWQVCITSYQIVLADQHIFRRKSWQYMILDEAHNIKNFRSQRWQTLLGFKAQRRLLLTGTPLQNNLMELWSLLYFLMPNGVTADASSVVGFANHKEFSEWFSNPMDKAVESGETMDSETLETISRLHTLLRPFLLRRLKSEVETQLPGKFEHVVYCRLSKRQRFLYDEFMSRSSTKEALSSGGYLGVVNTLMQLRKVCNHPDLFEVRPVRTSFAMERSVVADFEPMDILLRKRLLQDQDEKLDLGSWNLEFTKLDLGLQSSWTSGALKKLDASDLLPMTTPLIPQKKDDRTVEGWIKYRKYLQDEESIARWDSIRNVNRRRCSAAPMYGSTMLSMLSDLPNRLFPASRADLIHDLTPPASLLIQSYVSRAKAVEPLLDHFAVIPPNAVTRDISKYTLPNLEPASHPSFLDPSFDSLHHSAVKLQIAFPDASLLQYDCGKLQKLYEMLRELKAGGHRVLIFTQMTKVLDILEMFLSYNGHRYLRLDGSTKIEDRQIITERFNGDERIFCFIASSRSGGVGINLTGADTVFFYDSDWNPSMDRQCMDRAHRIGQTREVHIYRFVSSHTVEENMLKKANQKRLLDNVVIQQGDFTTEFFGKMDWRDMLDEDMTKKTEIEDEEEEDQIVDVEVEGSPQAEYTETTVPRMGEERELAKALAEVEDEEDAEAARIAQGEGELDVQEFDGGAEGEKNARREVEVVVQEAEEEEEEEDEDDVGGIDEYMLKLVEWDWDYFVSF
ncbi:helicase SRCAP/SWR1, partial [Tremellales sp. Uapishka_1]